MPKEAEVIYERLLAAVKRKFWRKWHRNSWKVPVFERVFALHRDSILRYYQDFVAATDLAPDRGSFGDQENYDR